MTSSFTAAPPDQEGNTGHNVDGPLLSLAHSRFLSTSTGSMELAGLRDRRLTKVSDFESQFRQPEGSATVMETVRGVVGRKWAKLSVKKTLARSVPIVGVLGRYRVLRDLPSDLVAGLTSGMMMIPQGLAFASLSTLKPIIGLYISLFSSLTYFLLGMGQQSSFGCIAILSIMMGAILDKYEAQHLQPTNQNCNSQLVTTTAASLLNSTALLSTGTTLSLNASQMTLATEGGGEEEAGLQAVKLQVAGSVSLLCGVFLVVLGKLGLGRLTIVMSDSLVTGFTVGAAFHIGSSQLKTMFGLGFLPRYNGVFKLLRLWYSILSHINRSNLASIIASAILILIIYLVKRFINEKYKSKLRVPVPIEAIVVGLATVVTYYADLHERYHISIIKDVPTGVPAPHLPDPGVGVEYLGDGLAIIAVAFIQSMSVAKLMGLKHGYRVDPNQEMFAVGMVNVVCSVFSGYISGASVSRSVVQDSAGGCTQVASLVAALMVLLVMLFMGRYFYHVPKVALSAIIVVSLRSLFLKLLTVREMWRKSRVDCTIFVTTIMAVVVLDVDVGLLLGVGVSVLLVLAQSVLSCVDVTSRIGVGDLHLWRSCHKYHGGEEIPDVKVVRVNCSLFFINAEIATNAIFKKTGLNPLAKKDSKCAEKTADQGKGCDAQHGQAKQNVMQAMPNKGLNHIMEDVEQGALYKKSEADMDQRADPPSSVGEPSDLPFFTLVLDLSGTGFIDLMGVKALEFLIDKYTGIGVSVYMVNVTEKCLGTLQSSGFMGKHGDLVMLSMETVLQQLQTKGHP